MQQIKQDILISTKENIEKLLRDGEILVYTYEVVPLDYKIRDYTSPILWATNQRLFFTYDELVEMYEYREIEMDILGESPRFNAMQNLLEQKYYYSLATRDSYNQLKNSTFYPRFSFNEVKQIPKEFALRSEEKVAVSYQSWAMAQSIINLKNGLPEDRSLAELFKGSFAQYSQGMVVVFFALLIIYVLLKGLLGGLVDVIGVVLDVIFGIVSVYMIWWIYRTIDKNLKRYKAVYNKYRVDRGEALPKAQNIKEVSNAEETTTQQISTQQFSDQAPQVTQQSVQSITQSPEPVEQSKPQVSEQVVQQSFPQAHQQKSESAAENSQQTTKTVENITEESFNRIPIQPNIVNSQNNNQVNMPKSS